MAGEGLLPIAPHSIPSTSKHKQCQRFFDLLACHYGIRIGTNKSIAHQRSEFHFIIKSKYLTLQSSTKDKFL
jgi:hypothetical protein